MMIDLSEDYVEREIAIGSDGKVELKLITEGTEVVMLLSVDDFEAIFEQYMTLLDYEEEPADE